tara:strand:+ start:800 stop:1288 length:489 start_codon:yes stop_codon:yes gene_type:complete
MAYAKDYSRKSDPKEGRDNVKKWLGIIWYFIIGSETIYHIFKGLYLTWIFSIKVPMTKVLQRMPNWDPQASTDMVGLTLFSLQEWQYHFMFGLRGPMVLFGAYLLYRYTVYLSPFNKKNNSSRGRSGSGGRSGNSNPSARKSVSNTGDSRRGRSSGSARNRS